MISSLCTFLAAFVWMLPFTTAPQTFGDKTYQTDTIDVVASQQTVPLAAPLAITFLGHGSLLIAYNGRTIYVDPVSDYANYTHFPKADLILITHEHADHLDLKAIGAIVRNETVIVPNAASAQKIDNKTWQVKMLKNGEKFGAAGDITVEAVPAYNTTTGRDKFHPQHRDNGYILTLGSVRIYIAGDTEDIPEMASFEAIDIAFLPINQPYTMTPAQAARAVRMLKPKVVYPYHFGETSATEMTRVLQAVEPKADIRLREMK